MSTSSTRKRNVQEIYPVQEIYFYDNDWVNKFNDNLCKNIKFIWVDASGNTLGPPPLVLDRAKTVEQNISEAGLHGYTHQWSSVPGSLISYIQHRYDDQLLGRTQKPSALISHIQHRNYSVNEPQKWRQNPSVLVKGSDAWLIGLFSKNESGSCGYDPRAGIKVILSDFKSESFFQHVIRAADLTSNVSQFVFDWDRTLQVMEGMFPIDIENDETDPDKFGWIKRLNNMTDAYTRNFPRRKPLRTKSWNRAETINALCEYHAGGKKRLAQLRVMFQAIGDKPVTIITASPTANTHKHVYITILKNWGCTSIRGVHYSQNKYAKMYELGLGENGRSDSYSKMKTMLTMFKLRF